MVDEFYKEQLRRRTRKEQIGKVLVILFLLLLVYRTAPLIRDWCFYMLNHI